MSNEFSGNEFPSWNAQQIKSLLSEFFNESVVDDGLWVAGSNLGRLATTALGAYSLAETRNEEVTVADWTEHFAADRQKFNGQLAAYIREKYDDMSNVDARVVDTRLGEIITAQSILPKPVLTDEVLVFVTEELARHPIMGMDNLIMLAGLLSRTQLAILLNNLPDANLYSKEAIKKRARQVDNSLMFDLSDDYQMTPAYRKFIATKNKALTTNKVQAYNADIWGPKLFFKKEDDNKLALVRRIDVANFAAWLKTYEAAGIWKELGFDYIPVEPILHFEFDETHGSVDCRTVLLRSRSLAEVASTADDIKKKLLNKQARQIKKGLDRIGVEHGHLHAQNFLVDETKSEPRMYVIDFDKALIKKNIAA